MAGQNVRSVSGGYVTDMLTAAGITATASGSPIYKDAPIASFQATVIGTGAVTATVIIEGSNHSSDGTIGGTIYWCDTVLGTITLSGTTSDSDGFSTNSTWKFVRARLTAITGTGAVVTCKMGT